MQHIYNCVMLLFLSKYHGYSLNFDTSKFFEKIVTQYCVKWLSGLLCYNNASCKYWSWIEELDGLVDGCYLKYANPGLTYMEDVISGGKNCTTGNNSEPYQHFFFTFSDKVKQDPQETCPQICRITL